VPNVLSDYVFHPSIASFDAKRAKAWFFEKLGVEPTIEWPDGQLDYRFGSSGMGVYEAGSAGTAKNTVAAWNVPDVVAEVARLRARGVVFEDYDFGEYKTVDGVMTDPQGFQTAWFKDADGNIHSLVTIPEMPSVKVTAMIGAADLERAKRWYDEKLGFSPGSESDGEVAVYRSGDGTFSVYRTTFAGTAENTIGVWEVADLRSEVAALRARGLTLEDLEFGHNKTVEGISADEDGSLQAWFRDIDGNWLTIREEHGNPG
jgi:catechol 2,3-dioxygenase-like lactoylglutathione lyase family enzyme